MNLAILKARLKELAGEIATLLQKDSLSAEELAQLDAKTTESEECEKNIATLERAELARSRAAQPASTPVVQPQSPVAAEVKDNFTASEKIGFMAVAVVKAKQNGATSPEAVLKVLDDAGYGFLAKEFDSKQRALNASSATAGGIFVPEEISNEVVELLRPMSTFLRGGPRRVTFDRGNFHLPAAASGAQAYWRGEGQPIMPSQPTFRDINLSAKFLGALVPITEQLLRWSRIDIRNWVERDMALAMATEVDRAAYFGSGTVNQPQGILNITGVGSIAASGGTSPTVAQIEANAASLELAQMMTNLPANGLAWVMSPRTMIFLQNLRDGLGNRYFPELQNANPTWRNKPVLLTTTFPVNLGVGTNESVLALINFGDVFYGESRGLTFAASNEASYKNNSGTMVSAFQNELLVIRSTTEVDVGLRYLQAVQKLTGLQWGA
jgi:HK97 family phage major capsid protein